MRFRMLLLLMDMWFLGCVWVVHAETPLWERPVFERTQSFGRALSLIPNVNEDLGREFLDLSELSRYDGTKIYSDVEQTTLRGWENYVADRRQVTTATVLTRDGVTVASVFRGVGERGRFPVGGVEPYNASMTDEINYSQQIGQVSAAIRWKDTVSAGLTVEPNRLRGTPTGGFLTVTVPITHTIEGEIGFDRLPVAVLTGGLFDVLTVPFAVYRQRLYGGVSIRLPRSELAVGAGLMTPGGYVLNEIDGVSQDLQPRGGWETRVSASTVQGRYTLFYDFIASRVGYNLSYSTRDAAFIDNAIGEGLDVHMRGGIRFSDLVSCSLHYGAIEGTIDSATLRLTPIVPFLAFVPSRGTLDEARIELREMGGALRLRASKGPLSGYVAGGYTYLEGMTALTFSWVEGLFKRQYYSSDLQLFEDGLHLISLEGSLSMELSRTVRVFGRLKQFIPIIDMAEHEDADRPAPVDDVVRQVSESSEGSAAYTWAFGIAVDM